MNSQRYQTAAICFCAIAIASCTLKTPIASPSKETSQETQIPVLEPRTPTDWLVAGALEQIGKTTLYDPAYVGIAYPNGDVPIERGVCTDVVVRALRKTGVDLQVLIHEDMKRAFHAYPNLWNLSRPDSNIDHRRVPNINTFLRRQGKAVPITQNPNDYRPGDIIAWELPSGLLHMGVLSHVRVPGTARYQAIHNISSGTELEDILFRFKIIGHFRYF